MSLIFEFFSGIGGFHQALSLYQSLNKQITIKKIFPYDVNINANAVYEHNFSITPSSHTLECFKTEDYNRHCENYLERGSDIIWFMSPPCQPFTSLGLQKDLNDDRTAGFQNLIEKYSNAWSMLIKSLQIKDYDYRQFILSPHQFGVPNRRIRYYLLARGPKVKKFTQSDVSKEDIITSEEVFHNEFKEKHESTTIKNFLNIKHDFNHDLILNKCLYLSDKHFVNDSKTYGNICSLSSTNTNCFTKGYSKLLKGSGSVLYFDEKEDGVNIIKKLKNSLN